MAKTATVRQHARREKLKLDAASKLQEYLRKDADCKKLS